MFQKPITRALKSLHTAAVHDAVVAQEPNKVLGGPAPEISPEEIDMPRAARTTLSQLRSSYSIRLNTYRRSIGLSDSDLCPECNVAPHTTRHVFNCTAKPTSLSFIDLWTHPKEVIAFLMDLNPFRDHLPEDPPAPPPPPEPPPT